MLASRRVCQDQNHNPRREKCQNNEILRVGATPKELLVPKRRMIRKILKSASSGRRLHWIFEFSPVILPFYLQSFCSSLQGSRPKMWRKSPDSEAKKISVESQRSPNPPEFAQPRLSRVKPRSSPARGYKNLGVCLFLYGWYYAGAKLQIWVCLICVILPLFRPTQTSGTAKGGRPWRGSVKIEPGFFQVFFKNPEKTRLKRGKNPEKTRLKPGKKPAGKCGEYAESWGSGDVVTDRGRTSHVPARGKPGKKPGSIFHRPPPHRPLLAGAENGAVQIRVGLELA